jgi:hypothetical protein
MLPPQNGDEKTRAQLCAARTMELVPMNEINTGIRQRVDETRSRLLDVIDGLLDRMTPPPEPPAVAIAVKRRQVANIMRLWMFCDRTQCRRSRCCRGEPLNCLSIGLTLLPPESFEALTQNGKDRKRERRRRAVVRAATSAAP